MYLTRLLLDYRSDNVQRWLRNYYRIHQQLWKATPEAVQQEYRGNIGKSPPFLFRVNLHPYPHVLVQSAHTMDWMAIPELSKMLVIPPETKELITENFILAGKNLRFRIIANPIRKRIFENSPVAAKSKDHQRGWKQSKKVGIYSESEQLDWLVRKGKSGGFRLLNAIVESSERIITHKKSEIGDGGGIKQQILAVTFSGVLEITESVSFTHTLTSGIGSAKAFGCGLLQLARV